MRRTILVVGGSSGIGDGVSRGLVEANDRVYLVSRNRPSSLDMDDSIERIWIKADLNSPLSVDTICSEIKEEPLDIIVFTAGTWESERDIAKVSSQEIYSILAVNVSSFVAIVAALKINLVKAERALVVALSSTAGLENATGPRAAYAASKFGVRGAVYSLREYFRSDQIALTVISPGGLASDVPYAKGADFALEKYNATRIPTQDIVNLIKSLYQLSPASCAKEIILPASQDHGV